MPISEIIPNVGASITVLLGLMALLTPVKTAAKLGLSPDGVLGRSEIRATHGGLFTTLGVTCLWFQSDQVFAITGIAWLGAALGRLISIVIERKLSADNAIAFLIEALMGASMFLPHVILG